MQTEKPPRLYFLWMNAGGLWFLYIIWKFTSRLHGYCVCFSQPFWMNPRGIGITTPTLAEITSPQNALNSSWGKTVICPGHSNLSKRCGLSVMDKKIHSPIPRFVTQEMPGPWWRGIEAQRRLVDRYRGVSGAKYGWKDVTWGVQRHTVSYFLGIYRSESILQYHFLSLGSICLWISLFFLENRFRFGPNSFFSLITTPHHCGQTLLIVQGCQV